MRVTNAQARIRSIAIGNNDPESTSGYALTTESPGESQHQTDDGDDGRSPEAEHPENQLSAKPAELYINARFERNKLALHPRLERVYSRVDSRLDRVHPRVKRVEPGLHARPVQIVDFLELTLIRSVHSVEPLHQLVRDFIPESLVKLP